MVEPAQSPAANPEPAFARLPLTGWQRRVFRIVFGMSIFFQVIYGLCILGQFFFAIFGVQLPRTGFPLGNPTNVAVDSKGRIYVAEFTYSRIQRYSPDGEFELGWWVSEGSYHFALRTTPDDRIQVATAGDRLVTYSSDGELLSTEWIRYENLVAQFESDTTTSAGYAVRHGFFPRVIDTRTGKTVIRTTWPKILVTLPFPAMWYFLIAAIGFGISALWAWLARRKQQRSNRTVNAVG